MFHRGAPLLRCSCGGGGYGLNVRLGFRLWSLGRNTSLSFSSSSCPVVWPTHPWSHTGWYPRPSSDSSQNLSSPSLTLTPPRRYETLRSLYHRDTSLWELLGRLQRTRPPLLSSFLLWPSIYEVVRQCITTHFSPALSSIQYLNHLGRRRKDRLGSPLST